MEEDNKILDEFSKKNGVFKPLNKWINKVNFFDVSGMTNLEIKHSNTLAWFFNANENHGLKGSVIHNFLLKVINYNFDIIREADWRFLSQIDYRSFMVKREWKNIDILLFSRELKVVITIENKVKAPEGKTQLNKYLNIIRKEFRDFDKFIYIFLTPEGEEPSDTENWCIANYNMIIDSISDAINITKRVNKKTKELAEDYILMVRRNFVMDEELKKKARDIYRKNKKALDLIYDAVASNHAQFCEYIKGWLEKNSEKLGISFDGKNSSTKRIRFTTRFIDELFPFDNEITDSWGKGHGFMYEITVGDSGISVTGVLAKFDSKYSDLLLNEFSKTRDKKKHVTILESNKLLSKEDVADGLGNEVTPILIEALENKMTKHIHSFETIIKNKI